MIKYLLTVLLYLFLTSNSLAIDTKAEQAIVLDFDTNEVLFEKNSNLRTPPASMTKIMTVYAVFDRIKNTDLSINDVCIVSAKAYKMGGSRTFLEIDDRVSIDELLKGIIIQSGNDSSIAIAECLAGTEEDFAKLMNVYAKKLNMKNTNFINSSGWPDDNHFSTVRDISILSNALIRDFPNLYKYFNLKNFTYNNIKQPNRNKLLTNFLGADGLKTGFTKKSGWGISGSAIQNGRRVTVVINGTNSSRSRLNESIYLLNWSFTQTSQKKLLSKGDFIKEVDVWLGNKPRVKLIVNKDILLTLSFDQEKLIDTEIIFESPISAPIKKGDKLGEMKINISGKDSITVPLISDSNIRQINPIFRIFSAIKYLIFGNSLNEA